MSTPYELHGNVAVITLNNPPVNGLSHALRSQIVDGVDAARRDSKAQAIVLIGSERAFSGGADITEFGTPAAFAEPNLHTVIETVECSDKPVIAAIGGACMGGGLELALGCPLPGRARRRSDCPARGQARHPARRRRHPALCRAWSASKTALNMIVSGEIVPAQKLEGTQLFDEIVTGQPARGRSGLRRARWSPRSVRSRRCATSSSSYAEADGLLPVRAQHRGRHVQELPGAAQVRRCGGRRGHRSPSTRVCASSATCSPSSCRPTSPRRCGTCVLR